MFDEQEEFDLCIDWLANVAYNIKCDPETAYTKIITSTNTVKEVGKHLWPKLIQKLNDSNNAELEGAEFVSMVHFGDKRVFTASSYRASLNNQYPLRLSA